MHARGNSAYACYFCINADAWIDDVLMDGHTPIASVQLSDNI